ncbi:hypothetical protein [Yinghuangia sp. YIM S09857]|uniref:hypothetical protein n=1 Tax=Yinghuangia sp. YIM S09857 TaxID=3436929 RepID=UPI003F530A18
MRGDLPKVRDLCMANLVSRRGRKPRFRLAIAVVVVALFVGGCGMSADPKKQAPRLDPVAVRASAERHAAAVMNALGAQGPGRDPRGNESPCEGAKGEIADESGPRSLFFSVGAGVPEADQRAATVRLRADLEQRGLEILETRNGADGQPAAYLRARDPRDGFKYIVQATASKDWMEVWVFSPCFVPLQPTPLNYL